MGQSYNSGCVSEGFRKPHLAAVPSDFSIWRPISEGIKDPSHFALEGAVPALAAAVLLPSPLTASGTAFKRACSEGKLTATQPSFYL